MAQKKDIPDGYVEVVLMQNRVGLGRTGDTVAVGEERAKRWCDEGISRRPGRRGRRPDPETLEDDQSENGDDSQETDTGGDSEVMKTGGL